MSDGVTTNNLEQATEVAELVARGKLKDAKQLLQKASPEERAALLAQFSQYDDSVSKKVTGMLGEKELRVPPKPNLSTEEAQTLQSRVETNGKPSLAPEVGKKLETLNKPDTSKQSLQAALQEGEIVGDEVIFKVDAVAKAASDRTTAALPVHHESITVTEKIDPPSKPSIWSRIAHWTINPIVHVGQVVLHSLAPEPTSREELPRPVEQEADLKEPRKQEPTVTARRAPVEFRDPYVAQELPSRPDPVITPVDLKDIRDSHATRSTAQVQEELSAILALAASTKDAAVLFALSGDLSRLSAQAGGNYQARQAILEAQMRVREALSQKAKSS